MRRDNVLALGLSVLFTVAGVIALATGHYTTGVLAIIGFGWAAVLAAKVLLLERHERRANEVRARDAPGSPALEVRGGSLRRRA
jgi:hypothetical protein